EIPAHTLCRGKQRGDRMRNSRTRFIFCFAALITAMFTFSAHAQTCPTKPIRLIAAYPPGTGTDALSRYFAERLPPVLGQPVLVENKAGAQGIVGGTGSSRASMARC